MFVLGFLHTLLLLHQSKPGKPLRVTLINAKVFARQSTMQGSLCFRLQVATPEATGWSATNLPGPVNLDGVLKEYHDFADVFSKSKAGVLADHRPYDLKKDHPRGWGVTPPRTNLLTVAGGTTHPP